MDEEKVIAEAMSEETAEVSEVIETVAEAKETVEEAAEAADPELTEEERKAAKKKAFWIEFWSNVKFFAFTFLFLYALFYVFPPYLVSGDSMNNTLTDKAMGFGMRFVSPEQGDIVVLNNAKTLGKDYIKRVIGTPGDTVLIQGEKVYVNGELLEEDYAYYDPQNPIPEGYHYEITLGEDEFFVMGDNRCHSRDSRSIGAIHRDDFKCKMLFFIWGKH